jgi:hypothetical protein
MAEDNDKRERGRPTPYKAEYCEIAENMALLGLNDEEMAKVLSIATSTFYKWQHDHPEFSEAITRGKVPADGIIAKALFKRAMGMTISEDALTRDGEVVSLRKELPPDTAAAKHWLGNRQREKWASNGDTNITTTEPLIIIRTEGKDD